MAKTSYFKWSKKEGAISYELHQMKCNDKIISDFRQSWVPLCTNVFMKILLSFRPFTIHLTSFKKLNSIFCQVD